MRASLQKHVYVGAVCWRAELHALSLLRALVVLRHVYRDDEKGLHYLPAALVQDASLLTSSLHAGFDGMYCRGSRCGRKLLDRHVSALCLRVGLSAGELACVRSVCGRYATA